MKRKESRTENIVFSLIEKYKLYVLPLHSIDANGKCTCGKENCNSPGKHPYFKWNWKIVATNDLEKINSWRKKHKNINWAILTGRKSPVTNKYLVVIDIDKENHDFTKTLPETFSYNTGNGHHFWYWSDLPVGNSVSSIQDKIDVRGMNGYVVIPPSKHASGRRYKLYRKFSDIGMVPEFIYEKENNLKVFNKISNSDNIDKEKINKYRLVSFNEKVSIGKIRNFINENPSENKIKMGSRNNTIFRLLCSDRAKGAEEEELIKNAVIYRNSCEEKESIQIDELRNIVKSVLKYQPGINGPLFSYYNRNIEQIKFCDFDKQFLSFIKPSLVNQMSLNEILETRKKFLISIGIYDHKMNFTIQELAKYIKQKLYIRQKRLKTGNIFYCYIEKFMI